MASLNPNAPPYIPSLHLLSLENYYSAPLSQYPSPILSPLCFQDNQIPYQSSAFYTSSPSPYIHDVGYCLYPQASFICGDDVGYYLYPQASFICGDRKEFPCYFDQIPQPCPPRSFPHPFPLPPSGLQQPQASLSLLSEEKEKPEDHVAPPTQVKQEVEEKVSSKKVGKGVKGSEGFRAFASGGPFTGEREYMPKPARCEGRLPPLLQRRKLTGDYEFKKLEPGAGDLNRDAKTTVMIKNLPNRFTVEKLLDILDKHCVKENEKVFSLKRGKETCGVVKLGDGEGATTLSKFDFLYLPMDFRSGSNLGYAFVNFTSSTAARRLHDYLHKFQWKCLGSRKVCEVTYARIQALKRHFTNSVFPCDRDQFLPMCFEPSRSGFNQSEPAYVGRRCIIKNYELNR